MACQNHATHDPVNNPVPGCVQCDFYVKRPIKRCHGKGSSNSIVKHPNAPLPLPASPVNPEKP
jgi:hypothetical protein